MNTIKNKILTAIIAVIVLAGGMVAFADKTKIANEHELQDVELNLAVKSTPAPSVSTVKSVSDGEYVCVKPLQIVENPDKYLNKKIKFTAVFDKFSVLGLDYKPAFRDSQKYITFLVKRDDVTDHTIPLSEMKIFIKRSEAEKFIDLDSGDIIEVYGNVFSSALTDAWVDADKLVVVKKINKDKDQKS